MIAFIPWSTKGIVQDVLSYLGLKSQKIKSVHHIKYLMAWNILHTFDAFVFCSFGA